MINSGATLALDASSLSIGSADGLISVQSANSAHVGTHTATVKVTLSDYPSITSTLADFQITIEPCVV